MDTIKEIIEKKREQVYSLEPSSYYCASNHGISNFSGFSGEDDDLTEDQEIFIFSKEYRREMDAIFRD